jgi:hypothetical protein
MVNNGALAREMVVSAAAAAGIAITPEVRPLLERVGLRVLEDVFREEAAREVGRYNTRPEEDPSLAGFQLRTSAPTEALTPPAAPGAIAPPAPLPTPSDSGDTAAALVPPSTAAPPATTPAEPFSSLVEPLFEKRTREKIRQQGMAQERTTVRLFFKILGDRPARDYKR